MDGGKGLARSFVIQINDKGSKLSSRQRCKGNFLEKDVDKDQMWENWILINYKIKGVALTEFTKLLFQVFP